MTEPAINVSETTEADAAFTAINGACSLRGIEVARLDCLASNRLAVGLKGGKRVWPIYVDCNEAHLRLPQVWTDPPKEPLAHVNYVGEICVDDGQGLSLDPSRPADIAAHTVLKAYDLLESAAEDAGRGHMEFFNELEGYWLHLPNSVRSRAYFDVDGNSRMLKGFVNSKLGIPAWYFLERNGELPWEVANHKLAGQRALYVHVNELALPPVLPEVLTAEFIDDVLQRLSPEQLKLWESLIGPSKNSPKRLALLVSVPRQAGGRSLVGVTFGAKHGGVDRKSSVTPLTLRRLTPNHMRERGGASLDLFSKHIAVLGAGAVGSVVVDSLAAAGVGKLTVVDHDEYSEENVFRHLLPPLYIDTKKPLALQLDLEPRYPGLQITPVCTTAQKWLKTVDLLNYDAIVVAFGEPSLERSFSRALKDKQLDLPVVFTWLEALDLGGHSVLMWTNGEGCLDCIYRDDEGYASLAPRSSFLEPNQPITRNLTGCAGTFVPFGPIQARRTGLLATEHILSAITERAAGNSNRPPSYRFWVGDGRAATQLRLRTTPWFGAAGTTLPEDATRMVFGRPCGHCRAPEESA